MVEGIGDFVPGQEFTVMEIPQGRFGVVICFEVIFPELVRKFVRQGVQFMATLTNDAWFGRSSAPYQHFSMVVFRAVENRVPFIRAANTGITGSIDATGRIHGTTHLFTKTYLVQEIKLKESKSFYTQYGDLFAYLCGIITLVNIIRLLRREQKR
jgi:apolipoprotein N-acyltransferase